MVKNFQEETEEIELKKEGKKIIKNLGLKLRLVWLPIKF